MRHYLGLSVDSARSNKDVPVVYEPEVLLNAHLVITGMSGTGKSFQTIRLLDSAAEDGIEIDVFDVHEELHSVVGSVAAKYSQETRIGYNPLILDTDRHTGGVFRQADFLVGLIREVTPGMGPIQISCLRNLIIDTYAEYGIFQDDPSTWKRRSLTEMQREQATTMGRTAELRASYPTLTDLRRFMHRKLTSLTVGGDSESCSHFEALTRQVRQMHRAQSAASRTISKEEQAKADEKVAVLKSKCIESYVSALETQVNGRELDDILKYDSAAQISSLIARLDLLTSTGIFRANEPPFGGAKVRIHQIKSLSVEQQILFVKVRLREIFRRHVAAGPTATGTEVRHIVFIDEGHKYCRGGDDDIISVIAREARKYGIGLWMASQSPVDFPESLTSNVGATMLLGIHSMFWKKTMSNLRISEDDLTAIKAKEVVAVKMQREGQADPPFQTVIVPNPRTTDGKMALAYKMRHDHAEKTRKEKLAGAPPATRTSTSRPYAASVAGSA